MPVIKGEKKALEDRNAKLVKTVEFQLNKIIHLELLIKDACPVIWVQAENIQDAYNWEKKVQRVLSEREEKGE